MNLKKILEPETKKIPVLVKKSGENSGVVTRPIKPTQKNSSAFSSGPETEKCEKKVQLNELMPGVYELIFTCSCGEKTAIRLESLDKKPLPGSTDDKTPAPPPPSASSAE